MQKFLVTMEKKHSLTGNAVPEYREFLHKLHEKEFLGASWRIYQSNEKGMYQERSNH